MTSLNARFVETTKKAGMHADGKCLYLEVKEKYVRHKTRERNQEIIRHKKDKFRKKYGNLFVKFAILILMRFMERKATVL